MTKVFVRPQGHRCQISTGIHDCLTVGTGKLSDTGSAGLLDGGKTSPLKCDLRYFYGISA